MLAPQGLSLPINMSETSQVSETSIPGFSFLYDFSRADLVKSFLRPNSLKSNSSIEIHNSRSFSRSFADMNDLEASINSGDNEEIEIWKPRKTEWCVMATLAISSLLVALDSTILVPVLPTLAIELEGSAIEVFWIGTSYLLAHSVLQPFIAALSDIFGRRELLFPSILFFTIGSSVCGVAHNIATMLSGRVVQGIGGGGIITLAQVIFADIVPLRQRPKYFSVVLVAWAVGSVLGPSIGGSLVEKATWRWCFYLNLPICGVALTMTILFVTFTTEKQSLSSKLVRVDWIGGACFTTSLTALLVAISWGGIQFPWNGWQTIVPLAIGGFGILTFIFWERFYAKEPFLVSSVFSNNTTIAAYTCAMIQGLLLYMALYYISFYFAAVLLQNPLKAGISLLPATCLILPGSIVVSQLITYFGSYRWAIWSGWIISIIGTGLFILLRVDTKPAVWATALSIFGLGMGMVLSSTNFAVQASVDTKDAGRAAAMYAFMRSIGMTIGVAIGGSVFQNLTEHRLTELGLPEQIAHNAEAYTDSLAQMSKTDPTRIKTLQAFVSGFKGVFEVMTGICAIGLVISLAIKHHNMDRILESRHRLRGQE